MENPGGQSRVEARRTGRGRAETTVVIVPVDELHVLVVKPHIGVIAVTTARVHGDVAGCVEREPVETVRAGRTEVVDAVGGGAISHAVACDGNCPSDGFGLAGRRGRRTENRHAREDTDRPCRTGLGRNFAGHEKLVHNVDAIGWPRRGVAAASAPHESDVILSAGDKAGGGPPPRAASGGAGADAQSERADLNHIRQPGGPRRHHVHSDGRGGPVSNVEDGAGHGYVAAVLDVDLVGVGGA